MWIMATTPPTTSSAPWWDPGTIGMAGVIAGLLIKWAIDLTTARSRDRRDDRLRFIQDKRVAYADLLTACTEVAKVEHEYRLLLARAGRLDANGAWPTGEVDEYNADRQRLNKGRTAAYQALTNAHSVVEMVGPEGVVQCADLMVARCLTLTSCRPALRPNART